MEDLEIFKPASEHDYKFANKMVGTNINTLNSKSSGHSRNVNFNETFETSQIVEVEDLKIRLIELNQLLKAKRAAGRHKDLDDIENLS
jgi:hypothetical protein